MYMYIIIYILLYYIYIIYNVIVINIFEVKYNWCQFLHRWVTSWGTLSYSLICLI